MFPIIKSLRRFCLCQTTVTMLTVWVALSSCQIIHAHEISPSVGDLEISDDAVSLKIRLNAESFVARIDLQSLTDTDDTEDANDYDLYRTMEPPELEEAFRLYWPEMSQKLQIKAPEALILELTDITVPEVGNVDLPRKSEIDIRATVTSSAQAVTVSWPADYGTLIVRQQGVDSPYTGYLENGGTTEAIYRAGVTQRNAWQSFVYYIPVGFAHIIPKGLDHILFVLGLFFLASALKPLVVQISVFTLAHTTTLLFGALGWISVPSSVVEPLIALSIVFVAVENLFTDTLHRWRLLLIFFFGLLHGLGFASVLEEFGLPTLQFIPALLGFNIGVELGQLMVIAIAFFAITVWFRKKPWYRRLIVIPASLIIAVVGCWWFVERVFFA